MPFILFVPLMLTVIFLIIWKVYRVLRNQFGSDQLEPDVMPSLGEWLKSALSPNGHLNDTLR